MTEAPRAIRPTLVHGGLPPGEGVDPRVSMVLAVLRGRPVDEVAAEWDVLPSLLHRWVGDFVVAGGEVAAAAIVEGVARLLPGVVGNPESTESESFRGSQLEEPVYTRPASFRGWDVPEVLLSGDHGRIEAWRREQRSIRTAERRPDLGRNADKSET